MEPPGGLILDLTTLGWSTSWWTKVVFKLLVLLVRSMDLPAVHLHLRHLGFSTCKSPRSLGQILEVHLHLHLRHLRFLHLVLLQLLQLRHQRFLEERPWMGQARLDVTSLGILLLLPRPRLGHRLGLSSRELFRKGTWQMDLSSNLQPHTWMTGRLLALEPILEPLVILEHLFMEEQQLDLFLE